MTKRRKSNSLVGQMIGTGVGTMVGVGMIGATSSMVNSLPAGTAKTVAGVVPGLQSVALMGPNIKLAKSSFGKKKKGNYW